MLLAAEQQQEHGKEAGQCGQQGQDENDDPLFVLKLCFATHIAGTVGFKKAGPAQYQETKTEAIPAEQDGKGLLSTGGRCNKISKQSG